MTLRNGRVEFMIKPSIRLSPGLLLDPVSVSSSTLRIAEPSTSFDLIVTGFQILIHGCFSSFFQAHLLRYQNP